MYYHADVEVAGIVIAAIAALAGPAAVVAVIITIIKICSKKGNSSSYGNSYIIFSKVDSGSVQQQYFQGYKRPNNWTKRLKNEK